MTGRVAGKMALVTGAAQGLGRAHCIRLAQEGARVLATDINGAGAEETAAIINAEMGEGTAFGTAHDVTKPDQWEAAVDAARDKLGGLNVLVNNLADHVSKDALEDISAKQLKTTFENNVYPYFFVTRFALEHLGRGDSIINTGSVTSFRGSDHLLDYASTKGAIETFTYSLAKNLVKRGIRVNGVAPGPIWTPLITSTYGPKEQKAFGRETPMGRPGQPSELGPAYVFLASDDASYITGQFIHVNGGGFIG